jgi:hypothetical protein
MLPTVATGFNHLFEVRGTTQQVVEISEPQARTIPSQQPGELSPDAWHSPP